MYKIFIVEDDPVIAQAMKGSLESYGWEVRCADDFADIISLFVSFAPQLVLMDISLPFYNGCYWCTEIRKISRVPVIFISSHSDNMNIVMAMDMGGDDFIAKPFDLSVLTAKVRAMLRRTYDFAGSAHLIECCGAVLNVTDGTLTFSGKRLELTKNEYRNLQLLMENRGHIVSRDAIMTHLWQSDSFVDENTLTVNVTRLRKKLEGVGLSDFIRTKKGAGYIVD